MSDARTKNHFAPCTFNRNDAQAAADEWGFNCGPGALCAVLGRTPAEIRPHLGNFEEKGYTNPKLMVEILRGLQVSFKRHYECLGANKPGNPRHFALYPRFGLTRIQWGGPWTKPGVPIRARYRHTHWIAVRFPEAFGSDQTGRAWSSTPLVPEVFDINAICVGGWLGWEEWADRLVPWLMDQVEPKWDGEWWPTHSWEILNQSESRES